MPAKVWGLALAATLGVVFPSVARADFPVPLIQLTCAKNLHYASVRRLIVENAPGYKRRSPATDRQGETERADHIYGPDSLTRAPASCMIAAADTPDGRRSAVSLTLRADQSGTVDVMFEGESAAKIWTDLKGQTEGVDSVEFFANGVGVTRRICRYGAAPTESLTCEAVGLPARPAR